VVIVVIEEPFMSQEPYQQNPPYPPPYPSTSQVPYYPPPSYAQAPPPMYYNPELAPMPVSTSGWAIASLICSLVGIPLLGVIFGFIALGEIKNSFGRIGGEGMAKAGIIIGFVVMALTVLIAVVWVLFILGVILSSPSTNPSSFVALSRLIGLVA
jgi:hypothetical protein